MAKGESDYVKRLTYNTHGRMDILREMGVPARSAVFEKLSPYVQQSILKQLSIHEIVEMLDHMDMQQAQHILARITNAKRRDKVVQRLKGDVKEKIDYFLRFHPKATLSLINFNYLFLDGNITIKRASEIIGEHYEETAHYPEVLVHNNGELIGEVSLSVIVRERNTVLLKKCVTPVQTMTYQSEVNEIIDNIVSTNSKKIIILDHDTSVLGIVYAEAVRTLFGHLPAESLYDYAGVLDTERPFDAVGRKVRNRYKWLILNLATCFLAGSVVLAFQGTLDKLTILSVYIPIIAGMGGNAATQSFAIMVRGITLGTISLQNAMPAIWRELMAGFINGIIIGGIVAIVSSLWNGEPILGLVVALALIGAHIVAAVAGSLVPLVMKQLGNDPAATSTIFITTATDVLGIFFLLGLATLIML
ncbi:magnesium transporter [Candidatus Nomurabacteria bacterium]|nr:magnesium transporter [Candidatus Kaiserbacteria bacterium]MCB9815351.1 magnesium transporter [Candidatus Nomurabacteria bacterium]MCB9819573.1 magnesium transporter [Candidatus Nomurabacteria bacterium]